MTDAEFLAAFESQRIPQADWTHRGHVRAAYLLTLAHGHAAATDRMRVGIKLLNKSHGLVETPDRGYHETLTVVWVHLVAATIASRGPGGQGGKGVKGGASFDAFADEHPHLLCRTLPRLYYSPAGMPREARYAFIAPDLAPLPRISA